MTVSLIPETAPFTAEQRACCEQRLASISEEMASSDIKWAKRRMAREARSLPDPLLIEEKLSEEKRAPVEPAVVIEVPRKTSTGASEEESSAVVVEVPRAFTGEPSVVVAAGHSDYAKMELFEESQRAKKKKTQGVLIVLLVVVSIAIAYLVYRKTR